MLPTQLDESGETINLEGFGKNLILGLGQKGMHTHTHTHTHTLLTSIYLLRMHTLLDIVSRKWLKAQREVSTTPIRS